MQTSSSSIVRALGFAVCLLVLSAGIIPEVRAEEAAAATISVTTVPDSPRHSYGVVTVDAIPDGNFHYRLFAVVVNFGDLEGPAVPVRFAIDDTQGFPIEVRPAEQELAALEPGEERSVEAELELTAIDLEEREVLIGLSGTFSIESRDDDPEDDSFPWIVEFAEFGY